MSPTSPERQRGPRRRKRRRSDPAERRTPAQVAAQARIDREADHDNRSLSNAFGFWRLCNSRRCRRMHACAGLPDCFDDKWLHVQPDDRFVVREAALAGAQGADPKRASEIARQKLGERNALFANYDAVKARLAERGSDAAPLPEPRLRRL